MYLIKHICQSVLRPFCRKRRQQLLLNQNTPSIYSFHLSECVSAIYGHSDTNQRPCILTCLFFVFLKIARFVQQYKSVNLIADCLARFHQYGQLFVYRLVEGLKSAGASILLSAYFCLSRCYVLHKMYDNCYRFLYAISTDSAIHNQRHQQGRPYLELMIFSSWNQCTMLLYKSQINTLRK